MAVFAELDKLLSQQNNFQDSPSEYFASLGAPSVSIAVLDHGNIDTRCYSTVGDGITTRFQACSISKPVTAMAVMRLLDEGRLRLEDEIAQFLPQEIVDNLGPATLVHEITIKHILSHTAGLTTGGFVGYSSEGHPSATEVIIGKFPVNSQPIRVVGVPGRQWSYSGGEYSLLQIALETLTSQPFSTLMDELVLHPLGMKDSHYGVPESRTELAMPYWNGATPGPHWHYFPELAAAGLWTTPSDLCKVLHALQKSLVGDKGAFLESNTAKRMLTEVESTFMGLGWVAPRSPGTYFGHTGANDPGYRCVAMGIANLSEDENKFFNEGCGIVVMTNSAEGILPAFTAVQTIQYLKGWPEGATISKSMSFVTPLRLRNSELRQNWKDWQGRWVKEADEWFIETGNDGQPQARWHDRQPLKLYPAAICPKSYSQGHSVDLLLDGLRGMMRLGWRDGKASVDFMDGLTFEVTKLARSEE